jgi:hypothetical protein
MSLEQALQENTAALLQLTAVIAGKTATTSVGEPKKPDAPTAFSQPGATPPTTAPKAVAHATIPATVSATATVLNYEKDIKPVALQLAAKKGRDALLAVYTEVGVNAKDATPDQYPAMLAALQKSLAA